MTTLRAFSRPVLAPAKADVQCAALISLARRSFGVGGCSMKITEDVRKYAAEQNLAEEAAIERGLEEKAKERRRAPSSTRKRDSSSLESASRHVPNLGGVVEFRKKGLKNCA